MILGIRCSNKDFSYAVLSGTKNKPTVEHEGANKIPKNFSKPRALSWLVQEIEEIINKHNITKIVMRGFEGQVRKRTTYEERVELETAVYIAAAKCGINAVFKKVRSTIAKDLGLKGKAHYLQSLDTSSILGYDERSDIKKEAILAAWSEL